MPKRSKQLAAKYAEKSRTKKTEKRPNLSFHSSADAPDSADVPSNHEYVPQEENVASSAYRYVSEDLRRMGITIAILVVILVIITVFLR